VINCAIQEDVAVDFNTEHHAAGGDVALKHGPFRVAPNHQRLRTSALVVNAQYVIRK